MEMTPRNMAVNWADLHGLTIKRLQKSYCAYKGEELIATGSSYGVLLNRMRERIGVEPVTTVDVSPRLTFANPAFAAPYLGEKAEHYFAPNPAKGGEIELFSLSSGASLRITQENLEHLYKETADFDLSEHADKTALFSLRVATGELIDHLLIPQGPWILSFSLDHHVCTAGFPSRSAAVAWSRAQYNKARRGGRVYTSKSVRHV